MEGSASSPTEAHHTTLGAVARSLSRQYERAVVLLDRKWFFWMAVFLLPLILLTYYSSTSEDTDLWFHLALGKHYVQNGTFAIDHTMYSWTPTDHEWIYGTWIGSSLLYLVYTSFSISGLVFLQWAIFLAIVLLYLWFLRVAGSPVQMVHLLVLLLAYIAMNLVAQYIKPEMFTMLFFAVAVFLYFCSKATSRNLFYLYPPLFLFWVNVHGGFLMGIIFLGVALCGEVMDRFFLRQNPLPDRLLKHFLAAVSASCIVLVVNPGGIYYPASLMEPLFGTFSSSADVQIQAYLSMWQALFSFPYRFLHTAWILVIGYALFLALCAYAYRKARLLDVSLLLLNTVFFMVGMQWARVTMFPPMVWMFSIAFVLSRIDGRSLLRALTPVFAAAFLVIGIYIVVLTSFLLWERSWFGTNIVRSFPAAEIDYVKRHAVPGPFFNDYILGGYLLWGLYPSQKVFIDPRYRPYWRETAPDYFNFHHMSSNANLRRLNTKYPFRAAIVGLDIDSMLNTFLYDPDWRLLYFGRTAAVFLHRSLLARLPTDAFRVELGPDRFSDVEEPLVLVRLFNVYLSIGPRPTQRIIRIYERNVSDLWWFKKEELESMRREYFRVFGLLPAGDR